MAKIIDITNKLNFEAKPVIKVKDVELQVNNDAVSMLKVTAIFGDKDISVDDILAVYKLLFDEDNQKKVESLHLSMNDFTTLIMKTAEVIINDGEESEGEAQTPATT